MIVLVCRCDGGGRHAHSQGVVEGLFTLQCVVAVQHDGLVASVLDIMPALKTLLTCTASPVRMQAAITFAEIAAQPVCGPSNKMFFLTICLFVCLFCFSTYAVLDFV